MVDSFVLFFFFFLIFKKGKNKKQEDMEKLVLLLLLCESAWAHGTLNKVAKQTCIHSMLYTHWLLATGVQHSIVLAYKDIVIIIIIIFVIIIRGGREEDFLLFNFQIEKMRQFLFCFPFYWLSWCSAGFTARWMTQEHAQHVCFVFFSFQVVVNSWSFLFFNKNYYFEIFFIV